MVDRDTPRYGLEALLTECKVVTVERGEGDRLRQLLVGAGFSEQHVIAVGTLGDLSGILEGNSFHAVFTDYDPDKLKEIVGCSNDVPVITLVEEYDTDSLVEALSGGAFDCVPNSSHEIFKAMYFAHQASLKGSGDKYAFLSQVSDPRSLLRIGLPAYREWCENSRDGNGTVAEQFRSLAAAAIEPFQEQLQRLRERGEELRVVGREEIRIVDDECAEGAILFNVNPNDRYKDRDSVHYACKFTDRISAEQIFMDLAVLRQSPDFQSYRIPEAFSDRPLPLHGNSYFFVSAMVIGPDARYVLLKIKEKTEKGSLDNRLGRFRNAIYAVQENRMHWWQHHSPPLLEPESPDGVAQRYIRNMVEAFRDRGRYTGVTFSLGELKEIEGVLGSFDWHSIITPKTIRRNLACSFRNLVFETRQMRIPIEDFVGIVTDSAGRVLTDRLRGMAYNIDWAPKMSHILEDYWEIWDFFEGGLTEQEKQTRAEKTFERYGELRGALADASPVIRLYRCIREADLFLSSYGLRNHEKLMRGIRSEDAFEAKKRLHEATIRAHDSIALEILQAKEHPLGALQPFVERVADFRYIDYNKPDSE